MAKVGEPIRINRVLDLRPRIFSLPVSIIVPMLFIVPGTGTICWMLQFSGPFTLFVVVISVAVYFFLFGQEYWRLLAKFSQVPIWARSDVKAVPFSLNRDERRKKTRKN